MRVLLYTEFTALLARAGVSQAGFARLSGVTPRQVNNWCRGRAAIPRWASALAIVLDERSPETIAILLEKATFTWCETLGLPSSADAHALQRALNELKVAYDLGRGGSQQQLNRINAAYERAVLDAGMRQPTRAALPSGTRRKP